MRLTTPDGVEIAYEDSGGSGVPTLFVHGITESGRAWAPIISRLKDRRVITLDLRGHGESSKAPAYDLAAMAGDVVAVLQATVGSEPAHLVGHSLGAMVVTAVGAALPVASVVNVDQSLRLGEFKAQLDAMAADLGTPASFESTLAQHFHEIAGSLMSDAVRTTLTNLRRLDQDVVLGIWSMSMAVSTDELNAVVEEALGGYAGKPTPYLTVFGNAPEAGYAEWISQHVPGARMELWTEHGHHPHLLDPERFVATLRTFWD